MLGGHGLSKYLQPEEGIEQGEGGQVNCLQQIFDPVFGSSYPVSELSFCCITARQSSEVGSIPGFFRLTFKGKC